jgi:hypothetical protein
MAVAKVKLPTKKIDLPVPADVVINESEPEEPEEPEPEEAVPEPVKAKKALTNKKDKDKPKVKRAPSAYNNFVSAKMHQIRAEKAGLPPTEYMKLVSGLWKTTSDAEKKTYATVAA